jgi:hypothetical protein
MAINILLNQRKVLKNTNYHKTYASMPSADRPFNNNLKYASMLNTTVAQVAYPAFKVVILRT